MATKVEQQEMRRANEKAPTPAKVFGQRVFTAHKAPCAIHTWSQPPCYNPPSLETTAELSHKTPAPRRAISHNR
jgi:hypothetical protein